MTGADSRSLIRPPPGLLGSVPGGQVLLEGWVDRPLDVAGLGHALAEVEPAAVLVSPRMLRRVIKRDRGLPFLHFQALHQQVYAIAPEALGRAIGEGGLPGADDGRPPGGPLILLARPDPDDLAASSRGAVLDHYWRLLFHARARLALEARLAVGGVGERVARVGAVEFEEVRAVLRQDGMLLPPYDDREVYAEFTATYLGLRHFAPSRLPHEFPGIEDHEAIEALLAEDIDATSLLAATRPPGAPGLDRAAVAEEPIDHGPPPEEEEPPALPGLAHGRPRRLMRRAAAAGERGNAVRAAILRARAARVGPPDLAEPLRIGARAELDRLARRLARALGLDDAELDRWRHALPPLLDRSARGFWTPEARLLYDLQRVCVDHEREVFTIDLLGWLASYGRAPLRRPQPHLREVMISNHLRRASRRLREVRLGRDDRARLDARLRSALAHAEHALRDRFRGPIDRTLEATGIRPRNAPERVAFRKLIEELLDRIVGRGFLTLGDLRDACSRSNLKLPDLSGPGELIRGDRLLQADEALARALDGVYRRGEVYLRWLQRFSALMFATRGGRFATLYAALPYGGAFLVLAGLQELIELAGSPFGVRQHVRLANPASLLLLGTVALGAVNFIGFRVRLLAWLRAFWRAIRAVVYDLPAWVLGRRFVRLLFEGRLALAAWRVALKPALATLPVWGLLRLAGLDRRDEAPILAVAFVAMGLVLNSRAGRDLEEIVADEAVRAWRQLHRDLIPGMFRLIMATFDRILETVERLLYAVDEWLRFRSGQGRLSLAGKAVLGAVWAIVAYLVRIYVNLLIEPQVNPIKHFPVVTVSHKIMLPFLPRLTRLLAAPLKPLLGKVAADHVRLGRTSCSCRACSASWSGSSRRTGGCTRPTAARRWGR